MRKVRVRRKVLARRDMRLLEDSKQRPVRALDGTLFRLHYFDALRCRTEEGRTIVRLRIKPVGPH